MKSVIGRSGETLLYVFALGSRPTLVRLNPSTLTREWEFAFPTFPVLHDWTVDSAGNVYVLGGDLWKIRPDGSLAWRAPFRFPNELIFDWWQFGSIRLAPLNDGRLALGSTAFHSDYGSRAFVALVEQQGDTNGDGCVDDADPLIVLTSFGGNNPSADLNNDGLVDDADLLEVLFAFGNGC